MSPLNLLHPTPMTTNDTHHPRVAGCPPPQPVTEPKRGSRLHLRSRSSRPTCSAHFSRPEATSAPPSWRPSGRSLPLLATGREDVKGIIDAGPPRATGDVSCSVHRKGARSSDRSPEGLTV